MKIFISYASECFAEADQLAASLRNEGHLVFIDRDKLAPANSYDDTIRRNIGSAGLFIFLISPESVQEGRYTLTELKFARERWGKTHENILPVMIRPTPIASMPGHLRSVTILTPDGKFIPEVLAQVRRIAISKRRRRIFGLYIPAASAAGLLTFLVFSDTIPGGKEFVRQYIYRDVSRGVLEAHILENLKDDNFCDTAILNATKLTADHPTYARGFRHLGTAYYCARKFDLAVQAFEKAVTLDPANPDYKFGLAANLALAGNFERANGLYEEIVAEYQARGIHYSAGLYNIALNTAAAKKYDKALQLFRKMQWDPTYGEKARASYLLCQLALARDESVPTLAKELLTATAGNEDLAMAVRGTIAPGRRGNEYIPFTWIVEGLGKRKQALVAGLGDASQ